MKLMTLSDDVRLTYQHFTSKEKLGFGKRATEFAIT